MFKREKLVYGSIRSEYLHDKKKYTGDGGRTGRTNAMKHTPGIKMCHSNSQSRRRESRQDYFRVEQASVGRCPFQGCRQSRLYMCLVYRPRASTS